MMNITDWIDSKSHDGEGAVSGDVYDPATGRVSGKIDFASMEVVDEAVAAAYPSWSTTSLARRTEIQFSIRELPSSGSATWPGALQPSTARRWTMPRGRSAEDSRWRS